jgi:serine/threonine protein kinase
LAARLLDDQSRRWQEGDAIRVEAYLEQHPELRDDPDGLLDLIFNEILLREEQGEVPDPAEYVERFPWMADQIRLHFTVHQFMQPETVVLSGSNPEEPQTAAPAGLPDIAGYEVLGEIGRGGMGVVYQARHRALRRLVALKMILAGPYATPEEVRRLQVEAEAIARVQHPNIVQIYEVGVHDGRPYLALEYVDGERLDRRIAGTPQPARPAAQLIETLARAVHAAHQTGIIHRDLKPANILLTEDRGQRTEDSQNVSAGTSTLSSVLCPLLSRLPTSASPSGSKTAAQARRRAAISSALPRMRPPNRRSASSRRSAPPRTCTRWEPSCTNC